MTSRPMGGGSRADQRFRRQERIRKRDKFLEIQDGGRRIHLADLVVLWKTAPEGRRIGITVSKKVGNAVRRNRVKRLVREVWRRKRELLPMGHDMVFVAKRSAAGASYRRIERQFEDLSRRLGS